MSLTLTADDYVAASKLHVISFYRSRRFLIAVTLLVLVYLTLLASVRGYGWDSSMAVVLHIYAAAFIGILAANYFVLAPILARRNFRKHKALHHLYTYSWSETGLTLAGSRGQWLVLWTDYLKWRESEHVLLFYQGPRVFNLFPKRVLTAEQVSDVRQCAGHIVE